ncbi:hypothetical protein Aph02nite_86250 [Actinoplanes philippinensis]|uniref:Uncharacterized protein n=1 Tax=Actinoplanes philippinensis TaxID=35752 RepID=A0A1I2LNH9_9ACTN|nr:hypothetical protein [Actinoplanes philippinensis]GIE82675.1 hypothetical protein Aph02nite_86250 [Actinoplanes philippinensis]SFF80825.1 hypothetical protein SAMN05421541_12323 [Actinoplanes philippinensis]
MTPHLATGAPAADAAGAPAPSHPAASSAGAPGSPYPTSSPAGASGSPYSAASSDRAPGSSYPDGTRPASSAGAARIVGVSRGHATLAEADHWIQALTPAPVLACTHLISEPFPHVAISLLTAHTFETDPELATAVATAEAGKSGRAVRFPGVERLTGALTVSEILQRSSIARVEILGGGQATPDTVVETGDFVRPQFRDGELILITTPAAGGTLVPFETRTPTPCCADH